MRTLPLPLLPLLPPLELLSLPSLLLLRGTSLHLFLFSLSVFFSASPLFSELPTITVLGFHLKLGSVDDRRFHLRLFYSVVHLYRFCSDTTLHRFAFTFFRFFWPAISESSTSHVLQNHSLGRETCR